jgi:hypothetical protein
MNSPYSIKATFHFRENGEDRFIPCTIIGFSTSEIGEVRGIAHDPFNRRLFVDVLSRFIIDEKLFGKAPNRSAGEKGKKKKQVKGDHHGTVRAV